MFRIFPWIVALPLIILAPVIAQEGEVPLPAFHFGHFDEMQDGRLSTDLTRWSAEKRQSFFGNFPPEHHQRYLDTYATLREASLAYFKVRGEVFEILHPRFFKEQAEEVRQRHEGEIASWKHSHVYSHMQNRQQTIERLERRFNDVREKLIDGNYTIVAGIRSRDYEHSYLRRSWFEFRDEYQPSLGKEKLDALAEEFFFMTNNAIDAFQRKTEEYKTQIAEFHKTNDIVEAFRQRAEVSQNVIFVSSRDIDETLRQLPFDLHNIESFNRLPWNSLHGRYPPTDEQKRRLLNDEPLFHSMSLGRGFFREAFPDIAAFEVLKASRDAEREPWRINATPELTKLGIDQAEIERWDGSLSLHPFIRAIAERCEGIDLTPLQTGIHHGSMGGWGGIVILDSDNPNASPWRDGKTLSNTHPSIMAVIRGQRDIAFSARRPSADEKAEALKLGIELVIVPFAKDAFVFLQNRYNPVRNLTQEQYQGIFSGKYRNWGDVGGNAEDYRWEHGVPQGGITPFTRNEQSGSEELMRMLVMRDVPVHENFIPRERVLLSMDMAFKSLENNPGGIAYSIYHYDRYMVFNVSTRVMAVDGVMPNADTIASDEYPFVYEPVLIHRKAPGERVERFVKWLLSDEGQRLVRSVGYVPMGEL